MPRVHYFCWDCQTRNEFDFTGKPGQPQLADRVSPATRAGHGLAGAALGFALLGPLGALLGAGLGVSDTSEPGEVRKCRSCGHQQRIYI